MYLPPPSTLPAGSIVDSYRRDSGGISQEKSTAQQLAVIEEFCKQHGLIHRHSFVDDARSGGSTEGRTDFARMLALYEIQNQRPNGLILWNYARFARDVDDAQLNKIQIRRWGVVIHSLNDHVPEGDYGRIVEFFIDMANEEKRKQTSADTKRGLRELVEKFGCVPGGLPTGFKKEPLQIGTRRDGSPRIAHRRLPDSKYKKRILQAFTLRAAKVSLGEIHKQTKLLGGINSYATFFANPIYKGTLVFGDYVKENFYEPMVPPDLWDKVQTIQHGYARTKSKGADHPRRVNSRFLLSGMANHLICGSPLYGHSSKQKNGKRSDSYFCTRAYRNRDCVKHRIPREILERAVLKALTEQILQPEYLDAVYETIQRSQHGAIENNKEQRSLLQQELTKTQRHIANTAESLAEHGSSKILIEKLKELEAKQLDLQNQILALEATAEQPIERIPPETVLAMLKDFQTRFDKADIPARRLLLRAFIDHVDVTRQDHRLHGRIYIKYPDNVPTSSSPSGPPKIPPQRRNFHFTYPLLYN